jgi:hypothetical protein
MQEVRGSPPKVCEHPAGNLTAHGGDAEIAPETNFYTLAMAPRFQMGCSRV